MDTNKHELFVFIRVHSWFKLLRYFMKALPQKAKDGLQHAVFWFKKGKSDEQG